MGDCCETFYQSRNGESSSMTVKQLNRQVKMWKIRYTGKKCFIFANKRDNQIIRENKNYQMAITILRVPQI